MENRTGTHFSGTSGICSASRTVEHNSPDNATPVVSESVLPETPAWREKIGAFTSAVSGFLNFCVLSAGLVAGFQSAALFLSFRRVLAIVYAHVVPAEQSPPELVSVGVNDSVQSFH